MDTASHILIGATLAGLSQLDPGLSGVPVAAVTAVTVLSSNAPDFDGVFRLGGKKNYIRHHRGISHCLPALFIWPTLITAVSAPFVKVPDVWPSIWLWSFIGVFLHVFLDMLNTYGVQCFRPITKRWVHVDVLCIFEPILFAMHAVGLVLWLAYNQDAVVIFAWIYGLTVLYIGVRAIWHNRLMRIVRVDFTQSKAYHVIPTFHPLRWQFVVETEGNFITGRIRGTQLRVEDSFDKNGDHEVVRATMGVDGVRAFLSFAQRVHVTYKEKQDGQGYEVSWSDARFYHNRLLAFGVDVQLDRDMKVIGQSIGWRNKKWQPPFM
jgi:inner membrane protein